eukprot:s607_g7.t2
MDVLVFSERFPWLQYSGRCDMFLSILENIRKFSSPLSEVLVFTKAPDPIKTDMTWDHLHATLTSLLELEFYALYLCSSPQRSACLLVETEAAEMKQVQATVLNEMKDEWNMLQEMEGNREMHALLRKECPFVFFHHFREVPVCFAQNQWTMCPDTFSCVQAWFPRFGFSSNIEDIFSSLQDACRRGVKNGDAGLSNLQCVTVRAIQQKMDVEGGPKLVQLESEDYEGNAIRSAEIRIDDVLKPYETTSTAAGGSETAVRWISAPGHTGRDADAGSGDQVRVFSYTVHWLPASWSAKLGVSLCLRRAAVGLPPVVDMVKSKAIVRLTSEQLSKLLGAHGVTARKNSTKTFKTRQLMQLPLVTEHCSQEELTALDDLLKQIDAKRRKQPKEEQQGDEDEEEAPVGEIVRQDEDEGPGPDAADPTAAAERADGEPGDGEQQGEQKIRESRKAMSSCNPVPDWLQSRYHMPDDCIVTHLVHTTKMLPHFQVRLGSGKTYEGKILESIAFCSPVLCFVRQ